MKKRLQSLISGLLIGIIISSGGVFSKQISETAELFYNNIKITLNGKEIKPTDANGNIVEPFAINGTTYLPVRGISSALGLNVDWDSKTNTVLLSDKTINQNTENNKASLNSESVEVVKEYNWKDDYKSYVAIVIKNVSNKVLSPRIQISFKKSNGTIVGADNKSEDAFGIGNEMLFIFSNDEDFEIYEYRISYPEETYYDECVSKLQTTVSTTDKKAIIQVTNNGDKPAKFVNYTVLFKNGDKVVSYERGYCTDDDNEIKPGMTEIKEASVGYKKSFDSVEVYFTGRSNK